MINSENIAILLLIGAAGALVKDLIQDGCIELPKKQAGKIYLGCFSGMIIGAFAGYLIDGSLPTAFMGGYMGSSIIQSLIPKKYDTIGGENSESCSPSFGNDAGQNNVSGD